MSTKRKPARVPLAPQSAPVPVRERGGRRRGRGFGGGVASSPDIEADVSPLCPPFSPPPPQTTEVGQKKAEGDAHFAKKEVRRRECV
jgi:hypothetical protein